jgi:hypothetical protein
MFFLVHVIIVWRQENSFLKWVGEDLFLKFSANFQKILSSSLYIVYSIRLEGLYHFKRNLSEKGLEVCF